MDPVVHFEMPYDDAKRMSAFYQQAFGWQARALGAAMGNDVVVTTAESTPAGPIRPGSINGGFFERKAGWPDQHRSVVIAVHAAAAAMEKVRQAGGEVLGEPMDIPGVGRYVSFRDTEGNRVSLLEPLPRQQ